MPDDKNIIKRLSQAREAGLSDMDIQQQLKAAGLDEAKINELLVRRYSPQTEKPPAPQAEELIVRAGNLPNIFTLLGEAWNIYKYNFKKFFVLSSIMLLLGLVVAFIYFIIGDILNDIGLTTLFEFEDREFTADLIEMITLMALFAAAWIITAFIFSWLQAALIITIHEKDKSLKAIINHSLRLLIPFWWISLLTSFFIVGALVLLFIPGVILTVWFSITLFVFIAEGIGGLQALLKSKEYVLGYWWAVLIRQIIIIAIICLPLIAIYYIFQFAQATDFGAWLILILIPFLIPFGYSYCYALYRHLRYIKGQNIPVMQEKAGIVISAIAGWLLLPLIIIFLTGGIL